MPAQTMPGQPLATPVVMMLIIGAISLAPFLSIMLTSFVKVSVVLSLIRNALGTQQVPSGLVTNGLALILTIFIMAPVAQRVYAASGIRDNGRQVFASDNLTALYRAADKGKKPLREFLLRHAHAQDRALFLSLAQRLERSGQQGQAAAPAQNPPQPPAQPPPATQDAGEERIRPDEEFRIVLPAFVTSELKSAFQVGFLILLPFLIVDLVIANILVATGLQMVQPAIVSLPVKILLFVVADGWYLIVRGLVLSYA
jgi:type III secretion protein R